MAADSIGVIRSRSLAVARFPGLAPGRLVARQAMRGALIWGLVFASVVWALVTEFGKEYPTAADRAREAATYGSNVGLQAIFGQTHHMETLAGYTQFHLIGVLGIIGAIWGLVAATRLLRGEEQAGRWELLVAGQTTRRRAAAAAIAGLGVALFGLWTVTAAAVVAMGRLADPQFPVEDSLLAAVAAVAGAGIFLAVGALCSQLAPTRRQAAGWAAGAFGAVYLIRFVAYGSNSLRWLHWVSPLGWIDELRPMTGSRPLLLVPITGLIVILVGLAIVLAGRRDLGASTLPAKDSATARTRFLNGPLGLAFRLGLGGALAWVVGLGAVGLIMGLITKSTEIALGDQSQAEFLQRLGGTAGGKVFLGLTFLIAALLVAVTAAGQVAATREEEAEGYLDHLLARPVARASWLAGRFAVSAVVLAGIGVVTGLLTWVGTASTDAGLSFTSLLAAGINLVPAGVFVLGIGTLAQGLAPRIATAVAYGVVVWSFLVELVGAGLGASQWLLDLSLLHHIARAPAEAVRWDSAAILVALGLAAAAIGAMAFARRDLKGA